MSLKLANPYHHYSITECSRPLRHVSYLNNDTIFLWDDFKLCARCGDREAFEQAFEQMSVGRLRRLAELDAERDRREADRQRVWEERHTRLVCLRAVLLGVCSDLPAWYSVRIEEIEENSNAFHIWHGGVRFTIEEDPES